jgi:hypothetical protein
VATLIEPHIIFDALKTVFGTVLDDVRFDKCWHLRGDEQTACQFVAILNKVQDEDEADDSGDDGSTENPIPTEPGKLR